MKELSTVFKPLTKAAARALNRLKFGENADKIKINPEKPSSYDYMKDNTTGVK